MRNTKLMWLAPIWGVVLAASLSACGATIESGGSAQDGSSDSETAVAVNDGDVTIESDGGDVDLDDVTSGDDADVAVDLDCDGKDLEISEDGAVVTTLGECGTITVTGDGANIVIDSAESVLIDANDVILTAMNSGPVEVRGDNAVVTVTFMDGEFTDSGNNNQLISAM